MNTLVITLAAVALVVALLALVLAILGAVGLGRIVQNLDAWRTDQEPLTHAPPRPRPR